MVVGCVGVDLVELDGWRARALLIARSSPDPARSLQVMRDKAAALFGLGDLRQREIPVSESTNTRADGQEGRIVDEQPCCFEPAILEAAGGAATNAVQTDCPREQVMPRWGDLAHGNSPVGALVCAAALAVRVIVVQAKEDDSLVVSFQFNSKQKGKIKKCITKRVKMKTSVISMAAIVDLFDGNNGKDPARTLHKNGNRTKIKLADRVAVDSGVSSDLSAKSAASLGDGRRAQ